MADPVTIQALTESVQAVSGFIDAIKDLAVSLLTGIASVIASSALIAKYMPPPEGNTLLAKVHKLINSWAQNSGHAANAEKVCR